MGSDLRSQRCCPTICQRFSYACAIFLAWSAAVYLQEERYKIPTTTDQVVYPQPLAASSTYAKTLDEGGDNALRTIQHVSRPVIREYVQSFSSAILEAKQAYVEPNGQSISPETIQELPTQVGVPGAEQAASPASMHDLPTHVGGHVAGQDYAREEDEPRLSTLSANADDHVIHESDRQ